MNRRIRNAPINIGPTETFVHNIKSGRSMQMRQKLGHIVLVSDLAIEICNDLILKSNYQI